MGLRNSELNGQHAEDRLPEIELAVTHSAVRFDFRPSMVPSGRRIGTLAFAVPGFATTEFREVADIVAGAPPSLFEDNVAMSLRDRVYALANKLPLYRGVLS